MTSSDQTIVAKALKILESRAKYHNVVMSNPGIVREYVRLRIGALEHEMFGVLWLDAQNRLIEAEDMFRGTLTQTSVYPREVAKSALLKNAAGCIFYHNHPSGVAEYSHADVALTASLKTALAMFDVRVLDHFIVGDNETLSMAERGVL